VLISPRRAGYLRSLRAAVVGLVLAFGIGALLAGLLGYPVIDGFAALVKYSIGTNAKLGNTLANAVPLVLCGLSAAIAFASGPVNLGQPGQVVMGALFAVCGGLWFDFPAFIQVPLLLGLSIAGGASWALVAAFAKRRFGMDEFIVTLMLNEIGLLFTDWAISSPLRDPNAGSVTTRTMSPRGFLPKWGIWQSSTIVMVAAVVVSWIVVHRLVIGYEWRMAGQAPLFARLGGVEVGRNFTAAMAYTGGLAGLAGGVLLMAGPHKFGKGIGGNYGWDGVMIAVVAVNALLGVALYGLLFSALQTGSIGMEILSDIPQEFVQILQAAIVLITVAARGVLTATLAAYTAKRAAKRLPPPPSQN
jgi:general nucleoside transport system permease protein